jgi:hypothetical protein
MNVTSSPRGAADAPAGEDLDARTQPNISNLLRC